MTASPEEKASRPGRPAGRPRTYRVPTAEGAERYGVPIGSLTTLAEGRMQKHPAAEQAQRRECGALAQTAQVTAQTASGR